LSRLNPLDRVLVLILVPLWGVCFGIALKTQVRGGGTAALALLVEAADAYPTLTGDFPGFTGTDPLAQAGLQAGDHLIRFGATDLRGVGSHEFAAIATEEGQGRLEVPTVFERDGVRGETSFPLIPQAIFRPTLAASFAFAVSALFLLLRAQPTPTVRTYFHGSMAWAFANCSFSGDRLEFYTWHTLWVIAALGVHGLSFRFLLRFPDDRVPPGRWNEIWPWALALPAASGNFLVYTRWMAIGQTIFQWTAALGAAGMIAVATYKYRRADATARRQMKWALFGVYCAALPAGLVAAAFALDPRIGALWFPSIWAAALFPFFFVVSVLWFNLFDVDRLLSATASYNVLAVLLGAGALVVVPRVAEAASGVVGVDPVTGQVLLSLGLAALVVPAHRRLRPQIDRVFFRERYAFDQGIADLLPTLSACANASELTERVGAGLHRLLRPDVCVVYAASGESYVPVFVEGKAVPPAFGAESPLIGALRAHSSPLSLSDAGRRPDKAPLGPFDAAALQTLQAEVVLPVRQGDALTAFLCLGPKGSGDVYTSTDLTLLTAVAEAVSRELRQFDQEQTIREGREMQASLRRYVPGAIADQLGSGGAALASGEREVSVLFVDIRGYTGFSENRRPEEIFSTVNRYTETVSEIVQRHSGSVVEFNGDGMMAVFGAPRELAHKERAAVEAGREIVAAVGVLPVDDGETKLSVGVGIATGEAFVGNIQAVDRLIWSAIGNTTNLAARLQSLTRELDASMVIDAATWQAAQHAAEGFEWRPSVPIRGRRESQDLYTLPMQRDS
jgi:class 3 adenylate cyclase